MPSIEFFLSIAVSIALATGAVLARVYIQTHEDVKRITRRVVKIGFYAIMVAFIAAGIFLLIAQWDSTKPATVGKVVQLCMMTGEITLMLMILWISVVFDLAVWYGEKTVKFPKKRQKVTTRN